MKHLLSQAGTIPSEAPNLVSLLRLHACGPFRPDAVMLTLGPVSLRERAAGLRVSSGRHLEVLSQSLCDLSVLLSVRRPT